VLRCFLCCRFRGGLQDGQPTPQLMKPARPGMNGELVTPAMGPWVPDGPVCCRRVSEQAVVLRRN
jgi:hypothetical protein